MRFVMKQTFTILTAFLLAPLAALHAESPRNLLWDGQFNTGLGNGFWTVCTGNHGPNLRRLWRDGVVVLEQDIGSRAYSLDDGAYTLTAWVRQRDGEEAKASVALSITNLNYYGEKEHNEWVARSKVVPGEWQRVELKFEVRQPVRRLVHVELHGEGAVEVDAVMLVPGSESATAYRAAAAVECGFQMAEETNTFVDGEPRKVDLVISNEGEPTKAAVTWQVFDHREEEVRRAALKIDAPHGGTRLPLAFEDLPWGGYRMACRAEGSPVIGDALCAMLPRIDHTQRPFWGADANIQPASFGFTYRLMQRLGMNTVNTLSCSGDQGRWGLCNPAPGEYVFTDEAVDAAAKAGIEVVGFLGLKHPPQWVDDRAFKADGKRRVLVDEAFFIAAFADYVEAYVKRFAGRVRTVLIEDEIHNWEFDSADHTALARVYRAAFQRAKAVAKQRGVELRVSLNATDLAFWEQWLKIVPADEIDFISGNYNLRPQATADLLNRVRERGLNVPEFRTIGVGQPGTMRGTSLPLDRPDGVSNPPGWFAWMALQQWWMDRAWDAPSRQPEVRMGYYDFRTLGQSAYIPVAGKSGIEYDNSPTLGMSAIVMLKHRLLGMSPLRDTQAAYSCNGSSTASKRVFAYPFRSAKTASIVLATADGQDLGNTWTLSGVDLSVMQPTDLFAQPLKRKDGTFIARELPVCLSTTPDKLSAALEQLRQLRAQPTAASQHFTLNVAPWTMELDADRDGILRLSRETKGKKQIILEGIASQPALPKPKITVNQRTGAAEATIEFLRYTLLVISMSPDGCTLDWRERNNLPKPLTRTIRFRIAQDGAGRDIVIQEGKAVRAGKLREDYGALFPAAMTPERSPLPDDASVVSLQDFATLELSAATGNAGFKPKQSLRWTTQDGQAWLQQRYDLEPFNGGGSKNVSGIHLGVSVR